MNKIAVFPGSFDPFTKGHEDIVRRALPMFDQVIIAMGINTNKTSMFTNASRIEHVQSIFSGEANVIIESYEGLTTDYCTQKGATSLIRGIRNSIDSEYEKSIAQMNRDLSGIETIFLMTAPQFSAINSSIVREIRKNNGDISPFVTNSDKLIIS